MSQKIPQYKVLLDKDKKNMLVKDHEYTTEEKQYNSPQKIVELVNTIFSANKLAEEQVFLLAMNTKCRIIGIFELSHGTVNASLCSTREAFIRLLLCGASGYVVVHNHPSGDCSPSREDHTVTKRFKDAGEMMGIAMHDHIIVGDGYFSFKENGSL